MHNTCLKCLQVLNVNPTGQYFADELLAPFVKTDAIHADLHIVDSFASFSSKNEVFSLIRPLIFVFMPKIITRYSSETTSLRKPHELGSQRFCPVCREVYPILPVPCKIEI